MPLQKRCSRSTIEMNPIFMAIFCKNWQCLWNKNKYFGFLWKIRATIIYEVSFIWTVLWRWMAQWLTKWLKYAAFWFRPTFRQLLAPKTLNSITSEATVQSEKMNLNRSRTFLLGNVRVNCSLWQTYYEYYRCRFVRWWTSAQSTSCFYIPATSAGRMISFSIVSNMNSGEGH